MRPPKGIDPRHRVLVEAGSMARRARVHIDAGALAGSQIHLTLAGTRLEAQVLTSSEASRQTLVAAMDRVRERLRARGVIVAGIPDGRDRRRGG